MVANRQLKKQSRATASANAGPRSRDAAPDRSANATRRVAGDANRPRPGPRPGPEAKPHDSYHRAAP